MRKFAVMSRFTPFSLNLGGRLLEIERPQVMAIVNVTPDSFFAGSRVQTADAVKRRVERLMADGADMLDIGAYSTRPGAADVNPDEEAARLVLGIEALRSVAPDVPVSVDTFRASAAQAAVSAGADMVNDISGGDLDPDMWPAVARMKVPYIVMHMRGTPATMQSMTDYADVVADVARDLGAKVNALSLLGVSDVIVDPGLGFAKTVEQNYALLAATDTLRELTGCPVLIGLSRKSMLTKPLGITADEALNATTAANVLALERGAAILRVHDPREARQAVAIHQLFNSRI